MKTPLIKPSLGREKIEAARKILRSGKIGDIVIYAGIGITLWLVMAFLPGWCVGVVLGAGAVMMAIWFEPLLALALIIVAVPFEIKKDVMGTFTLWTAEGFVFMAGVAWGVDFLGKKRLKLPPLPLMIGIVFFFVAIPLSFLNARSIPAGGKELLRWGEVFFLYLFIINFLKEKEIDAFLKWVFVVAAVAALIGIVQFFKSGFNYLKTTSTFQQHNPFAAYLGMLLPIPLSLFFHVRREKRIFWGISFFILFLGLICCFSRGAWLGFGVAFLLLFFLGRFKKRGLLYFIIPVCLVFGIFLSLSPVKRTQRFKQFFSDSAARARVDYFKIGLKMIKDKPIFGQGAGNYALFLPRYVPRPDECMKCHLHNLYLQIAVETGVIGLLSFLFLLGIHFMAGFQNLRYEVGQERFMIMLGLIGGLAAFCVHNLVDVVTTHHISLIFGLEMGILLLLGERLGTD